MHDFKLTTSHVISAIIALGILVFSFCLFNDFVGDDTEYLLKNPLMQSIRYLPIYFFGNEFDWGVGGPLGAHYRPLSNTFMSLVFTIFGPSVVAYHSLEVAIHIVNAILLLYLLKHFVKLPIAAFGSLVFLVHPINVEPVVYITDVQEILFTIFGLTAFYLMIYKKSSPKINALLILSWICAVMAKETGALYLIISGVYLWLFAKDRLTNYHWILFFLIFLYSLVHLVAGGASPGGPESPYQFIRASLETRLLNIPIVNFYYLKTFFFPKDLIFAQTWIIYTPTWQNFYLPLLLELAGLAVITTHLYWLRKDQRLQKSLIFFVVWLIIGLGMHTQIVPLEQTVSDRWFYFPIIGLIGIIAVILEYYFKFIKRWVNVFLVLAAIIVLALSVRSVIRITNWWTGYTLYTHDLALDPESYILQSSVGYELYQRQRYPEAIKHYEEALRVNPYQWDNMTNLASIYFVTGDIPKAKQLFETSLQHTDYYVTYTNLAWLLVYYDDPQVAQEFTKKAVEKFPRNAKLWFTLALAEYKLGNHRQALEAAYVAYQLSPEELTEQVYLRLLNNEPIELKPTRLPPN